MRCVEEFCHSSGVVTGVVSINPDVVQIAESRGIPVLAVESELLQDPAGMVEYSRLLHEFASNSSYDCLFSIENSLLIPEMILRGANRAVINLYPGDLEQKICVQPFSWAVVRGEDRIPLSWIQVDPNGSQTRLVHQEYVDLAASEPVGSADERFLDSCAEGFRTVCNRLYEGSNSSEFPRLQPEREKFRPTPFLGRSPGCVWIDWSWPATTIANNVRGAKLGSLRRLFGHVKFVHRGEFLILHECHVLQNGSGSSSAPPEQDAVPGLIRDVSENAVSVQTGQGILVLEQITDLLGQSVSLSERFRPGMILGANEEADFDPIQRSRAEKWISESVRSELFWAEVFEHAQPFAIPGFWLSGTTVMNHPTPIGGDVAESRAGDSIYRSDWHSLPLWAPELRSSAELSLWLSGILSAFLTRLVGSRPMSIAVDARSLFPTERAWQNLLCPFIPVSWTIDPGMPIPDSWWENRSRLLEMLEHAPFQIDLIPRLKPESTTGTTAPVSMAAFYSEHLTAYVGQSDILHSGWSSPAIGMELSPDNRFRFFSTTRSIHPIIAQGLSRAFNHFFDSLSENPGLELPFLNLGNAGQIRRLDPAFSFEESPSQTVMDLIEARVQKFPESIAVQQGEDRLTYSQLWGQAGMVASTLMRDGLRPADRVGIFMHRGPEFVIAFLGALRAGACVVLLARNQPDERLRVMASAADFDFLITDIPAAGECPGWAAGKSFLRIERHGGSQAFATPAHVAFDYSSPAYIIFTSGSTGVPKPVVVGHREFIHHSLAFQSAMELGQRDRCLQFAGLGFDVCLEEIFPALASGARVVLRDESMISSAALFWEQVRKLEITILNLPTAFWYSLVDESTPEMIAPCVRHLIVGGERVDEVYLKRWFELNPLRIRWWNGYGPTETTITATLYAVDVPPETPHQGNTVPIGYGLGCCDIFLVDALGKTLPPGIPGEILIAGSGVSRGYLNLPEQTAERFIEAPVVGRCVDHSRAYLSGDFGCMLQDGSLQFLGRDDNQVKIRGYRLELHEIEQKIESLHTVDQAIVLDFAPNGEQTRILAGFIKFAETAAGASDMSALRSDLARDLPDYMIPSVLLEMKSWPQTVNGKIDFRALRAAAEEAWRPSRSERAIPDLEALTPLQKQLIGIWKDIVHDHPGSLDSSFFDEGGDSLGAIRLLSRVGTVFNTSVTLSDFFARPTVNGLTAILQEHQIHSPESSSAASGTSAAPAHPAPTSLFVPLRESGRGHPVFFLPGGAGGDVETFIYRAMTDLLGKDLSVYAFQPLQPGMDAFPFDGVESMAANCIDGMKQLHPDGPYFIVGDCIGSILAFEVTSRLEASGAEVAMVALLDSRPSMHRESAIEAAFNAEEHTSPVMERLRRIGGHISSLARISPLKWPEYFRKRRERILLYQQAGDAVVEPLMESKVPEALGNTFFEMLLQHEPPRIAAPIEDFMPEDQKDVPIEDTWKFISSGVYTRHFFREADHDRYIGRPLEYVRDKKLDLIRTLDSRLRDHGAVNSDGAEPTTTSVSA